MTKAKHTPSSQTRLTPATGTLGTNEDPLFWAIEKVADDGSYLCELAHIHGGGGDAVSRGERDANAKLFLAAPDLMEALEAMLSHSDGWDVTQLRKRWGEQVVNEILTARAAVAKAKGEA